MSDRDLTLFVTIDQNKCCGYTRCAELCPELYKLDDDGFAYTDTDVVRPELEATARAGADACPEGAITLERRTP
jgi:ferredoxin